MDYNLSHAKDNNNLPISFISKTKLMNSFKFLFFQLNLDGVFDFSGLVFIIYSAILFGIGIVVFLISFIVSLFQKTLLGLTKAEIYMKSTLIPICMGLIGYFIILPMEKAEKKAADDIGFAYLFFGIIIMFIYANIKISRIKRTEK